MSNATIAARIIGDCQELIDKARGDCPDELLRNLYTRQCVDRLIDVIKLLDNRIDHLEHELKGEAQ